MKICKIIGCEKKVRAKGLCSTHYSRLLIHGNPEILLRRKKGTGTIRKRGDHIIRVDGKNHFQHVLIAEAALGKPLPNGACIHHADENPSNNTPGNLVICPSQAYHSLLHVRMRALAACGNANWRKCKRCGKHDAPENVSVYGNEAVHPKCNAINTRKHGGQK